MTSMVKVVAERPSDPSYIKDLKGNMHTVWQQLHFPQEHQNHRRGAYPTKSTGISYGGGSKVTVSISPSVLEYTEQCAPSAKT